MGLDHICELRVVKMFTDLYYYFLNGGKIIMYFGKRQLHQLIVTLLQYICGLQYNTLTNITQ